MRDQYAGDVSDVIKVAFLRALAGHDKRLGVAWYYVPMDDGGPDGRHLEWRSEAAWSLVDDELHRGLSSLSERSVQALEQAAIWPAGAVFHRDPMPARSGRDAWAAGKRAALNDADIVFLDPDNGIGPTGGIKHATFSEIRLLRKPGRSIVFISFPGRSMPHAEQVQQLHQRLQIDADVHNAVTLRTNVSVPRKPGSSSFVQRQRWLTVVDADAALSARAQAFADALAGIPRVRAHLHFTTSNETIAEQFR